MKNNKKEKKPIDTNKVSGGEQNSAGWNNRDIGFDYLNKDTNPKQ